MPANIVITKLNPPDLFKFNIYAEKTLSSQKDIKIAFAEVLKNLRLSQFLQVNDLFHQICSKTKSTWKYVRV